MTEREREVLAEIVTRPGQTIRDLRKTLSARFLVGLTVNELESRNYVEGRYTRQSEVKWYPTSRGEKKLRGDEE